MATDTATREAGGGQDALVASLRKALDRNRPRTHKERAEDPELVSVVLNPGTYSSVGNSRFGPGSRIYVTPEHAERLTTPTRYRPYAAARRLDDPEPDVRGDFPQVHGVGRYHPDSEHYKAPEAEPVEPAKGQTVTASGELAEGGNPRSSTRVRSGGDSGGDAGGKTSRAANQDPPGDGGKS